MQDRDRIVQDKVAEIMMKKNLYNGGLSGTTGMTLSPEATAFLDDRAAYNSAAFEDPTLNQLAVELDSLRELLSTSENIAVSNFIRSIGEGTGIDEANILTSTPQMLSSSVAAELKEYQDLESSFVTTPLKKEDDSVDIEAVPSPRELTEVADLVTNHNAPNTQSSLSTTQACATEETLNVPFSDVDSLVEIAEANPLKTPAEDRKERLAALMSKLANEFTKSEEESDLVHESIGRENPSFAITRTSDDDESTHVSNEALSDTGSLCSKQDDANSHNEGSHIAVTRQNSLAPAIETAMSLISLATVDPMLASIIEETECLAGDEEMSSNRKCDQKL